MVKSVAFSEIDLTFSSLSLSLNKLIDYMIQCYFIIAITVYHLALGICAQLVLSGSRQTDKHNHIE